MKKVMKAVVLVPIIVAFVSSMIIALILWLLLSNYQMCTIPFEQECKDINDVFLEDPVRNSEIVELSETMIDVRSKAIEGDNYSDEFKVLPVLDDNAVRKYDREDKSSNGESEDDNVIYEEEEEEEDTSADEPYKITDISSGDEKDRLKSALKNSLKGTLKTFDKASSEYGIDVRFMVATSIVETKSGTNKGITQRNSIGDMKCSAISKDDKEEFGISGCDGNNLIRFDTLEDGIYYKAKFFKEEFVNKGKETLGEIAQSYQTSASGRIINPQNKYVDIINEMSQKYGVPSILIAKIIDAESSFNPNAASGVGAQGLMQLMPATAEWLGVKNSFDPRQNIEGGTKYISQLLKKYDGNVSLALAAYNAGSGNVAKYGGIPPFKETQDYVKKITSGNWLAEVGLKLQSFGVKNLGDLGMAGVIEGGSGRGDRPNFSMYKSKDEKYKDEDGYMGEINEAEAQVRTLVQMDLQGILGMDSLKYETAQALYRIEHMIMNKRAEDPRLHVGHEGEFTPEAIKDEKERFEDMLEHEGFTELNRYPLSSAEQLVDKNYVLEESVLMLAARYQNWYPYMVVALNKVPENITNDNIEKLEDELLDLKNELDVDEELLSMLSIGRYMQVLALDTFGGKFHWFFDAGESEKDYTQEFLDYIKAQRKAAKDADTNGDGKIDEAEAEAFKERQSAKEKGWRAMLGDLVALGKEVIFNNNIDYQYFEFTVSNNQFMRYAIYNNTNEVAEIGAFSRTRCFFVDDYYYNKKAFLGLFADSETDKKISDFCVNINEETYGDGRMLWEESDVLDKKKLEQSISFQRTSLIYKQDEVLGELKIERDSKKKEVDKAQDVVNKIDKKIKKIDSNIAYSKRSKDWARDEEEVKVIDNYINQQYENRKVEEKDKGKAEKEVKEVTGEYNEAVQDVKDKEKLIKIMKDKLANINSTRASSLSEASNIASSIEPVEMDGSPSYDGVDFSEKPRPHDVYDVENIHGGFASIEGLEKKDSDTKGLFDAVDGNTVGVQEWTREYNEISVEYHNAANVYYDKLSKETKKKIEEMVPIIQDINGNTKKLARQKATIIAIKDFAVGMFDENGTLIGVIEKGSVGEVLKGKLYAKVVDMKDNQEHTVKFEEPLKPASKVKFKGKEYDLERTDSSYLEKKGIYYTSTWEAFKVAHNFDLLSSYLRENPDEIKLSEESNKDDKNEDEKEDKKEEKPDDKNKEESVKPTDEENSKRFDEDSLYSFMNMTNVDYSENDEFRKAFEDYLIYSSPKGMSVSSDEYSDYAGSAIDAGTYEGMKLSKPIGMNEGQKVRITSLKQGSRCLTSDSCRAHNGADIVGPNGAAPILAIADGEVVRKKYDYKVVNGSPRGYGWYVVIKHTNPTTSKTFYSLYGHMATGSVKVSVGDKVSSGQQIGYMGTTGGSTGIHLHLEVHQDKFSFTSDYRIDPLPLLYDGSSARCNAAMGEECNAKYGWK